MTKRELTELDNEIDEISQRLEWLDDTNNLEAQEIDLLFYRLDWIETTVQLSLKKLENNNASHA